ncbi:MAG TPA: class I SAM-dependent methyltransferase [Acidimicrobiales bacterium]|nr:class I SAM-dependent methyltransferase [Acidimicrobiales bacterium]
MPGDDALEALVAEAAAAPVDGWDFSWLEGRASEGRPPWGYARRLAERLSVSAACLDVQTGGAEVYTEALARAGRRPATVEATESWPPNLERARRNLEPFGGQVREAADEDPLPYPDGAFDLVVSRHPTVTVWAEAARVLRRGGRLLSQQVGPGSNRELTDFMMGPRPVSDRRSPERAVREAEAAGLRVVALAEARLPVEFYDVGAVVWFLRKVIWTVPDFDVTRYRDRLAVMHEEIGARGAFRAHSSRFLIEAVKAS